jgi:hypothetical protein
VPGAVAAEGDLAWRWWEHVSATAKITQGDLLVDCPVVEWDIAALGLVDDPLEAASVKGVRSIVLAQACDLSNDQPDDFVPFTHWRSTSRPGRQ